MNKLRDIVYVNGSKDFIIKISIHRIVYLTKSVHRNQLHFYILTVKNKKEKLRNQFHSPLQQKE